MGIKKALLLSFALSCMGAMAGEPGVIFLLASGQKVSFTFSSKPEITVGSTELTVSATDGVSVSYAFNEVQRFYYGDDVLDYETGIQDTEDKSAACPEFGFANGVITVTGLKSAERVSVYSLGGGKIGEAKTGKDGSARVDISGAPAGVYVVNAGSGVSFKLLKK